jgi:hypothetical protein
MKIHLVGDKPFHADGHKDGQQTEKLIVAFCNFANAPKNHTQGNKNQ